MTTTQVAAMRIKQVEVLGYNRGDTKFRLRLTFSNGKVARCVVSDFNLLRSCLRCGKDFRTRDIRKVYCCRLGHPNGETWRNKVLERDGHKCVWCGSTQDLEADHIKPKSLYPKLRYDVSNGRTLCWSCHIKTPTWGGTHAHHSKAEAD